MQIVISSGHGKYIRGASGFLDEVDEARRVVERVADFLREAGVDVTTYHDDVSDDQNENLNRIVDFHNSKNRDLDISVHFNAYETTSNPMGTECLYVTQEELARKVATAVADAGDLLDRGPKYRSDLYFLNNTSEPAILIETCFVDSSADAEDYKRNFEEICQAIASTVSGQEIEAPPERPDRPPIEPPELPTDVLLHVTGKCSWFGGPNDTGVSPSEGLAFIYEYEQRPDLFLPYQPSGTTGLARRLNPDVFYVACRWDYDVTPKEMLAEKRLQALVRANGYEILAWPADWGPNENTGRVADISPGLMSALGITTDDTVEVIYPAPAETQPGPEPEPEPEPERPEVIITVETRGDVMVTVDQVDPEAVPPVPPAPKPPRKKKRKQKLQRKKPVQKRKPLNKRRKK